MPLTHDIHHFCNLSERQTLSEIAIQGPKTHCLAIQQLFPLRLYFIIVDISNESTVTLDNLPILIAECLNDLHKVSRKTESAIFLAVHGQLGQLVSDYASAVPEELRGLILLGTVMPKRYSAISFPLPVLTIVGEIDGLMRITRVSNTLHDMIRSVKFDPGLAIQSPFIILGGSNHEVFISGNLPSNLHQLDIEAEVDKNVAVQRASIYTSMFLAHVLEEPVFLVKSAAVEFKKAFEMAQNITTPLEKLREITVDNLKSYWVKTAQKWLSGLSGKQSTQIEVEGFIGDSELPPVMDIEQGIPYIFTFSEVRRYAEKGNRDQDIGSFPQAPDEIVARMLGPERIRDYLQNTTIISYNYTCRDLNYASFMTAYHTASDRARSRYDNYHRGAIFEPDIEASSEEAWDGSRLNFNMYGSTLYVSSSVYKTPLNEDLERNNGLFYCKLLPPDRALEWIYVDSIRRTLPPTRP
ncbi:hypothetical protein Btru_072766 [Bulinus truncatus]|nr:hypothetical protein Btru_072766 [Bulinus truncatus]